MRAFSGSLVPWVSAKAESMSAVNAIEYGLFADMRARSRKVARWLGVDSESGVTAIEYGLIASLIAVVIIVAVALVGTNLTNTFNTVAGKLGT
jgi:pilus assembly protein Flp/PilA